jgi:multisubunit Na+/H+ antiporter MnhB subunit
MEEARLQHVKDVARMRKKRKEFKELINFLGVIVVSVVFLWVVAYAGFMIWKGV